MMIPAEICERYQVAPMEWYPDPSEFYRTFLIATDHIPNKIVEAQFLGQEVGDYSEMLTYRQEARDEVNRLAGEE